MEQIRWSLGNHIPRDDRHIWEEIRVGKASIQTYTGTTPQGYTMAFGSSSKVFTNGSMNDGDHIKAKLPLSPATIARNPHLFRPDPSAKLRTQKPECDNGHQGQDRTTQETEGATVVRVTIIVRRPRLLDSHDNQRSATKPLVDFITRGLGLKSDDTH